MRFIDRFFAMIDSHIDAAVVRVLARDKHMLAEQVAEVEKRAIATALRACRGNRVAAARQLGMSRAALYDRLARWPDLSESQST